MVLLKERITQMCWLDCMDAQAVLHHCCLYATKVSSGQCLFNIQMTKIRYGFRLTIEMRCRTQFYHVEINCYVRNRSALAVNCWVIIHCLEVSCKKDQIPSMQREWFISVQLTDKQWTITQQFKHLSRSISTWTHNKRRKQVWSLSFFQLSTIALKKSCQ